MYPFYEIKKVNKSYFSNGNYFFSINRFKNMNFPPHLHSYVELIYVTEGVLETKINNTSKILAEGEMAISFPDDIHSYRCDTYSRGFLLMFSPEIIRSFFENIRGKTLENPYICEELSEYNVRYILTTLMRNKNNYNEYMIKGALYSIFGILYTKLKYKKIDKSYDNTIQIILKYIGNNYCKKICLDDVAHDLGFSKFYISRIFNHNVGCNLNEYINKLRINKAQVLLKNTEMKVCNIALECGFQSLRNFNRVFKKLVGLTPTQWKNYE